MPLASLQSKRRSAVTAPPLTGPNPVRTNRLSE